MVTKSHHIMREPKYQFWVGRNLAVQAFFVSLFLQLKKMKSKY